MSISSINPATGEVLQTFDSLTESQLEEKIARSAEMFCEYRRTSSAVRAEELFCAAGILEAEKKSFARNNDPRNGQTHCRRGAGGGEVRLGLSLLRRER